MTLHSATFRIGLFALAFIAIVAPAFAQQDVSVYFMMRNKVGLIDHCEKAGELAPETATRAKQQVAIGLGVIAAPADPTIGDKAETLGREGKWGTRGVPVEQYARLFDQSVADFCKELAQ